MSSARSRARGGFALLLVMLLAFVAGTVMAILLLRASDAARAGQAQIDGYRLHHTQAGLRQVSEAWSSLAKRLPEREGPGSVIGFDLRVEDGTVMEVRFTDAQGGLRFEAVDGSDEANAALNRAAMLVRGNRQGSYTTMRRRGPGRVSLLTAPREVLEAVVLGVDANGSAQGFANAVLERRGTQRLEERDLDPIIAMAGLNPEKTSVLRDCVTIDPQLWFVQTTVRDRLAGVIDREGGLVLGTIRTAIGTQDPLGAASSGTTASATASNLAAAARSGSGQSLAWTVLTWTRLPLRPDGTSADMPEGWPSPGS